MSKAFITLFDEAFHGIAKGASGTHFVEKKESLFEVFDRLSSAEASIQQPGCSSIAAHLDHTRFYIQASNEYDPENPRPINWEDSWAKQSVDDQGWNDIRQELTNQYKIMRSRAEALHSEPDLDISIGIMSQLAHAAFHLGAIRQLLNQIEAKN